jgi:hypothetical protein
MGLKERIFFSVKEARLQQCCGTGIGCGTRTIGTVTFALAEL